MSLQTPAEPKKYTTVYSNFRGVDFTNDPINVWNRRTPTGLNMIPDEAGRPWKRPGWGYMITQPELTQLSGLHAELCKVVNMQTVTLSSKEHLIIICQGAVFDYCDDKLKVILKSSVDYRRTFYFEGAAVEGFYMFSGDVLYRYDGKTVEQQELYVPTVLVSREPSGGGTLLEPINLISNRRTESFYGNATDKEFFVSSTITDKNSVKVEVMNSSGKFETVTTGFSITDYSVIFDSPKPAVQTGEDNVRITYSASKTVETSGSAEFKVFLTPEENTALNYDTYSGMGVLPVGNVAFVNGVPQVTVKLTKSNGIEIALEYSSDYTVEYNPDGKVALNVSFPVDKYDIGEDVVSASCTYTYFVNSTNRTLQAFQQCRTTAIYGTGLAYSVFMSGSIHEGYKSRVWYSEVGNPTYFPDTNYFEAGGNDAAIMGLAKIGEYLGVIKQGDSTDSTIYLAYPVSFEDTTAYAVKQSVNGVGAVSINGVNNLGDELLFFSKEGIMAVDPTEKENDKKIRSRSFYLNKKLLSEPNPELATSYVWNRFYILCLNGHCYILDGTQKTSWANERTNLQYEGYYWENIPAKAFAQYDGDLWFAHSGGNVICRMKSERKDGEHVYSDDRKAIPCEWSTLLDNDGATNYYKNLQKKGCLVTLLPMANTGAKVYIKADDSEPEYVGEITAKDPTVPIEFYIEKKIKKYKRLQIIVRNDTADQGFGLQEIIKVYTLGSHSKNRG